MCDVIRLSSQVKWATSTSEGQGTDLGRGGVLSVSALSVSAESAVECHCLDVFCAASLTGTVWSAVSVPLDKTACGSNASLWPADPCLARFLKHPTAACRRPEEVVANLRDSGYWTSCVMSWFPKKKSRGEGSGQHGS